MRKGSKKPGRGKKRGEGAVMSRPKMGRPKLRLVSASGPNNPEFTPQDKEYFAALHQIVDDVFDRAAKVYEYTWSKLAANADLTYGTVERLGDRITLFPRFQTVYKLCRAVGWNLVTHAAQHKKSAGAAKLRVVGG